MRHLARQLAHRGARGIALSWPVSAAALGVNGGAAASSYRGLMRGAHRLISGSSSLSASSRSSRQLGGAALAASSAGGGVIGGARSLGGIGSMRIGGIAASASSLLLGAGGAPRRHQRHRPQRINIVSAAA